MRIASIIGRTVCIFGMWAWSCLAYSAPEAVADPDREAVDEVGLLAADPLNSGPAEERVEWSDSVEIVARAVTGSVVERRLNPEEIATLPGSLADPLRAVQSLPGVSRAPFGSGQLMVRGTRPEDSVTLVDGLRVPVAYHFTGVSTVINPDALEEVVFHPGGWGVRYGRALGGVVDLRTRSRLPEGGRSVVALDLFQATAFTEQRLGERTGVLLSARRSWLDALLGPALVLTGGEPLRAPRFYDLQLGLTHQIGDGTISGMAILSDDRFRVVGEGRGPDPLRYQTSFHKLRLRWDQPLGRGWRVDTSLLAGPESRSLELGDPEEGAGRELGLAAALVGDLPPRGAAAEEATVISLRQEWSRAPGAAGIGLSAGLDLQHGAHAIDYGFGEDLKAEGQITQPALYLEPQIEIGRLRLIPGLRAETLLVPDQPGRHALDPRLTASFRVQGTRVSAGVGRFSQPPAVRELLSEEGAGLGFARAFQVNLGIQQDLGGWQLGLVGYHHRYRELVVGREAAFRFDNSQLVAGEDLEPFANEGIGGATGIEALVRYSDPRWTLWVSGTLGRAWRIPRTGAARRPSSFDQPVLFNLLASRELPADFRLGARVRYASGAPMSEVTARVQALNSGAWMPVYGPRWEARAPHFFALDARIDREFVMRGWTLTAWIEVQNVTNRRNVEIPSWSADYSRFEPVVGLPVLPAFGLKGAW